MPSLFFHVLFTGCNSLTFVAHVKISAPVQVSCNFKYFEYSLCSMVPHSQVGSETRGRWAKLAPTITCNLPHPQGEYMRCDRSTYRNKKCWTFARRGVKRKWQRAKLATDSTNGQAVVFTKTKASFISSFSWSEFKGSWYSDFTKCFLK